MRFHTRFPAVLVALVMVGSGLLIAAPSASAMQYNPPPGVKLNNPLGSTANKLKIRNHIVRSIYSVPKGRRIRIMSWNIRSHQIAKALVKAHRRGVTVQVIIDSINTHASKPDPNNPIPADPTRNEDWFWMKREFKRANNRPGGYRSWARVCKASCRSRGGLPHVKMVLFDRVHKRKDVVMYSSGNLTNAASTIQWNDIYTVNGNKRLFKFANKVFNEMSHDRAVGQPWRVGSFGGRIRFGFFPWRGKGTAGDPVVRALNPVKCRSAGKGVGDGKGRTVIRIAQTSLAGSRGERIARKLKGLWNKGCHIQMVYALITPKIKGILRSKGGRGPMPIKQIAQDRDGDFVYDRYLHHKAMTISGHWGSNRRADYTWNGSANWQNYTLASDEIFTRLKGPGVRRTYNKFLKRLFRNPPRSARGQVPEGFARLAGIDPYAKMELH